MLKLPNSVISPQDGAYTLLRSQYLTHAILEDLVTFGFYETTLQFWFLHVISVFAQNFLFQSIIINNHIKINLNRLVYLTIYFYFLSWSHLVVCEIHMQWTYFSLYHITKTKRWSMVTHLCSLDPLQI